MTSLTKTFIGEFVTDDCLWLDPSWLIWGFSLAMTVFVLRAFICFLIVNQFDLIKHYKNYENYMQAKPCLSFNNNQISGDDSIYI